MKTKKKIKDLEKEYKLITNSQDVTALANGLGITDLQGCDGVFIKLDKEGDRVEEVFGFEGVVPLIEKPVIKLLHR